MLPSKAKMGEPCTGCGMCCGTEICGIGKEAFPNAEPPCPGLVYRENRIFCKLVLIEKLAGMPTLIADALGIGKGCCSDDYEPCQDEHEAERGL